MGYNPNVHGTGPKKNNQRRQRFNPHAGKKHSDIVRSHGPRGTNLEDMRNRVPTPHGWRISYFEGEDFEVFYEYFCARNGTGVIRNDEQDRLIRVLAGTVYVTMDSEIHTLYANQAMSLLKGTEYEISTSGDTDAEVLICQGSGYLKNVEQVTESTAHAVPVVPSPREAPPRDSRVDPTKAKLAAKQINAERKAREDRRRPVPGKTVKNELGEDVPPPSHKRAPLAGQQVQGANPQPVGAGGYSK